MSAILQGQIFSKMGQHYHSVSSTTLALWKVTSLLLSSTTSRGWGGTCSGRCGNLVPQRKVDPHWQNSIILIHRPSQIHLLPWMNCWCNGADPMSSVCCSSQPTFQHQQAMGLPREPEPLTAENTTAGVSKMQNQLFFLPLCWASSPLQARLLHGDSP